MKRLLSATTAVVASALLLAGCGGGGSPTDTPPAPTSPPADVSLSGVSEGFTALTAGTINIAAGMSGTQGDVTFNCASGGQDCVVTIAEDGTVTSTGGMVTAMDSVSYSLRLAQADLATAMADRDQARADLATAMADLSTAQADLMTAQTDLATAQTDLATAMADLSTTQADLMTAQTDLATAQTDLATAQADLATAQADLQQARTDLQMARAGLSDVDQRFNIYLTAQRALTAGEEAAESAGTAHMQATTLMLTTMATAGDSSAAMENATTIINAPGVIDSAMSTLTAQLASVNTALEAANGLTEGGGKTELIATLETVKEELEGHLETVRGHAGDSALAAAVARVTGGEDADPQGTPRSIANSVGGDIAAALAANAAGGGERVSHVNTDQTTVLADIDDALKEELEDRVGHTFAELFAGDLVDRRIVSGTATVAVKAKSVAGMTLTNGQTAAEMIADGTQGDATYKGIGGTVFCNGSDCAVEAVEDNPDTTVDESATMRKLVGSWYFTPTDAMAHWVPNPAEAGSFIADILFTSYGHWLVGANLDDPNTPDEWTVNTFATSGGGTDVDLTVRGGADDDYDGNTATYSGHAAGMSVRTSGDDTDSGRFTADVELTATFAAGNSTMNGTVDNFKGDATNPAWSMRLESIPLGTGRSGTAGIVVTNGVNGVWNGQAYGSDTEARPTGIYGDFVGHFMDGDAAGAYATRADSD